MKKRIWVGCLTCLMLLITGCQNRWGDTMAENWKVVSEITVTCENDGNLTRRVYTSQEKMRQILNRLRTVGQKSKPQVDPESLLSRTYCITLTHTDGSQRIYSTKADRYIREGRAPWQQADPEKISELNLLLQSLPGDDPRVGLRQDIPFLRPLPSFMPEIFAHIHPYVI